MAARSCVKTSKLSVPRFGKEALEHALDAGRFDVPELERLLRVNSKLAAENCMRYREFCSPENLPMPAIGAYTGAVFKRLSPGDFSPEDLDYAQRKLRISSFLYGLLRPLDGIKPYRLEGNVRLPVRGGKTMFDYWKPLLTDYFIAEIKEQGGVLVNLASSEMKDLFEWKRVEEAVRVITPEFQVWKNGKLATVVMYAKMCRGEMTRFLLKERIENLEDLKKFSWEGFVFDESRSSDTHLLFTQL